MKDNKEKPCPFHSKEARKVMFEHQRVQNILDDVGDILKKYT